MEIVYLIKDTLTEDEISTVMINTAITPLLGAICMTAKGVSIAQRFFVEYVLMLDKSFDEAEAEALRLSKASNLPMVIIGDFKESLKEIECGQTSLQL
jgi:hypothetical protein